MMCLTGSKMTVGQEDVCVCVHVCVVLVVVCVRVTDRE